jgi:hypothetical protein
MADRLLEHARARPRSGSNGRERGADANDALLADYYLWYYLHMGEKGSYALIDCHPRRCIEDLD